MFKKHGLYVKMVKDAEALETEKSFTVDVEAVSAAVMENMERAAIIFGTLYAFKSTVDTLSAVTLIAVRAKLLP